MADKNRWVIVSNRLPFKVKTNGKAALTASSGGLVTALGGLDTAQAMLWAGAFPGANAKEIWQELASKEQKKRFCPVFIDKETYDQYYNGLCNELLWPLFHYKSDFIDHETSKWDNYRKVNQKFAEVLLPQLKDSDLVWIHDYHLFLLPALLRKQRPGLKIGFFLHIPFPSSEVFRQLPMREEILHSLIQSNLIGFHDYEYLRHFGSSLYSVLGINSSLLAVNHDGHTAQLGVFPVSIDVKRFEKEARSVEVSRLIKNYKKKRTYKYLILGVDRLDYTKGVDLKLHAFQDLLRRHPDLREKVRLLQIAIPTRTKSPEYIKLKSHIEELVGKINGECGTIDHAPIQYLFSSVSFAELLALYRMADALMVSSKRDGLNLVALEYLAAQNSLNPGVCLLSEFTGSSSLLHHAIRINPWNTEDTSRKLHRALTMSLEERKANHEPMMKFLRSYTATDWASGFMKKLAQSDRPSKRTEGAEILQNDKFADLTSNLKNQKLSVLIDYDGTLVPFMNQPDDAVLPSDTRGLLEKLTRNPDIEVVITSGRPSSFLEREFSGLYVSLVAEDGSKYLARNSDSWTSLVNSDSTLWLPLAEQIMSDFSNRTPASFIEKKEYSICWHYRASPNDFAEYQARKLSTDLDNATSALPVTVVSGSKFVEARAAEANKGTFIRWYLKGLEKPEKTRVLAIGDDQTDEELFAALNKDDISIRVGRETTNANYLLKSPQEVKMLLSHLAQLPDLKDFGSVEQPH